MDSQTFYNLLAVLGAGAYLCFSVAIVGFFTQQSR